LSLYLVDDFLSGAQLSGNKRNEKFANHGLKGLLRHASTVFVISQGFGERIKKLYGVESNVLPLPYFYDEPKEHLQADQSRYILFLGSISHFYLDGLRLLAKWLDDYNEDAKDKVFLRFTQDNADFVRHEVGDYRCIVSKRCDSDLELYSTVHWAQFCFAPYSFEERYRIMVSTSFPSKLLDYLANAQNIIVFGPAYSSSAQYFKAHGLSGVYLTKADFKKAFLENLKSICPEDHSADYRRVLSEHHSLKEIRSILIKGFED
jgi:hypothetical protein